MVDDEKPREVLKEENKDLKALIVTLASTSDSLERGEKIYQSLGQTVRRMRVTLWIALIGLILDLALSLSFTFILNSQSHLNDRITDNSDRITKVSCDLNTILLQTDTPERYQQNPDKVTLVQNYHTLYESRKDLGCLPVMNEPVRNP